MRMPTEATTITHEEIQEVPQRSRFNCIRFEGHVVPQGLSKYFIARGCIVSANVFLTNSFVFLASSDAGCVDENGETIADCDGTTYGMAPSSLIINIQVIAGILSALLMPLFGAIVDFTKYRREAGIFVGALLALIQATQIGTGSSTWFFMAILQGIAGALFELLSLSVFSYMPEVARNVGPETITKFQGRFLMFQFVAQFSFLLAMVGTSFGLGWSSGFESVYVGRVAQGTLSFFLALTLTMAWRKLPSVPPQHNLADGDAIASAGFRQVGRTIRRIFRDFRKSLFPFMIAVTIGEAFAYSLTTISAIYLASFLGFNTTQVGVFFIIAQLGLLIGAQVGVVAGNLLGPKRSWAVSMFSLSLLAIIGAFALTRETGFETYAWGFVMGIFLGWHYCMMRTMFTLCLPKGQDAEMTGFFSYCTNILSWLPPLLFSVMVQQNIGQNYSLAALSLFGFANVILLLCMPSWSDMLQDVRKFDDIKVKSQELGSTNATEPKSTNRKQSAESLA